MNRTNERIAEVCALLDELIGWAEADAEHSRENGAVAQAREDLWRAAVLRNARKVVGDCRR